MIWYGNWICNPHWILYLKFGIQDLLHLSNLEYSSYCICQIAKFNVPLQNLILMKARNKMALYLDVRVCMLYQWLKNVMWYLDRTNLIETN